MEESLPELARRAHSPGRERPALHARRVCMRWSPLAVFLVLAAGAADLPAKESPKKALQNAPWNAPARKGLRYLDDHLFRLPEVQGTPRKPFTYAVAGLCYLMAERTVTGRSADRVRRVEEYLTRYIERVEQRVKDPSNLPGRHGMFSSNSLIQYTWPVAMTGMFFGELKARGRSRRAAKMIPRIVALLKDAQHESGGWGHGRVQNQGARGQNKKEKKKPDGGPFAGMKLPVRAGMGGYPPTLIAAANTSAIAMGLLATLPGSNADDSVKRARAYYAKARLDNGSFSYDPSQRSAGFAKTNAGRTAGAIYAMHCLGMARGDGFKKSVRYLMDNFAWIPEGHGSPCLNMMHGALTCHMLGKKEWTRFKKSFGDRLVAAQNDGGCLNCICENKAFGVTCDSKSHFGGIASFANGKKVYTTALHTFVLLLDRGQLKLAERRRPVSATRRRR